MKALKKKKWLSLGIAVIIPQVIGLIGAVATTRSVNTWYPKLRKPSFNPPSQVFAPVWTTLYLLMGIASWQVWRSEKKESQVHQALTFYGLQLAFNLLWSILFFGLRKIDWAVGEITILWILIAQTAVRFYQAKPLAGLLMLPYLLWTSFAGVLNAAILRLNKE